MTIAIVLVFSSAIIMTATAANDINCTNGNYDTFDKAIDAIAYCVFPSDRFNPECVSASCPKLNDTSLCPYTDNQVHLKNVEKTLQLITDCLGNENNCQTPFNPIPCPKFTTNIPELLPNTTLTGYCKTVGENNYVYNMADIVVRLIDDNQLKSSSIPISINVNNLAFYIDLECYVDSYIINNLVGTKVIFQLPGISVNASFNITSTILENVNEPLSSRKITINSVEVETNNSSVDLGPLNSVIGNVTELFASTTKEYFKKSTIPEAFGEFVSEFVDNSFEVTKTHCS
ncbi:hypothetical protein CHUAL_006507 [Chamberlinius hualienensis]